MQQQEIRETAKRTVHITKGTEHLAASACHAPSVRPLRVSVAYAGVERRQQWAGFKASRWWPMPVSFQVMLQETKMHLVAEAMAMMTTRN